MQHDCIKTAAYQRRSSSKTRIFADESSQISRIEAETAVIKEAVGNSLVKEAVQTAAEVKEAVETAAEFKEASRRFIQIIVA